VRPGRVRLIHHRAGDFSEFAEFLGSDIEFGATVDELTFAAPTADLPVVSADQYLNEVLIEMCEQAVSRRKKKRSLLRCAVENGGRAVDGEVELDYAPSGLVWLLTCSAANALEQRSGGAKPRVRAIAP
jgi:hypothetical protein